MDLQDFVRQSIEQVFRGVQAAGDVAKETGGEISPVHYGKAGRNYSEDNRPIVEMEFDVAVTVTDEAGAKGEIKVFGIGSIEGGGGASSSTVSRVRFQLPVALPKSGGTSGKV